jgi:hypothetical protein
LVPTAATKQCIAIRDWPEGMDRTDALLLFRLYNSNIII